MSKKEIVWHLSAPEKYAQYFQTIKKDNHENQGFYEFPMKHDILSIFSRDRNRIMYLPSFLRMSSKTQIFPAKEKDHFRTRLTHTIEVSQIARTICGELDLNQDLAEAISIGHDLGHTPFGHIGERTLNDLTSERKPSMRGFKHNLQSIRTLVDLSENTKITNFTLYGIREHSKRNWSNTEDVMFYDRYEPYYKFEFNGREQNAWSFEAFVVKISDEIAQRHHDIEDAYRGHIYSQNEIKDLAKRLIIFEETKNLKQKLEDLCNTEEKDEKRFIRNLSSYVVDVYITGVISRIKKIFNSFSEKYQIIDETTFTEKYPEIDEMEIQKIMDIEILFKEIDKSLKIDKKIVNMKKIQQRDYRGSNIVKELVKAFCSNPLLLPDDYISMIFNFSTSSITDIGQNERIEELIKKSTEYDISDLRYILKDSDNILLLDDFIMRISCDYVAGMTDLYAIDTYRYLNGM